VRLIIAGYAMTDTGLEMIDPYNDCDAEVRIVIRNGAVHVEWAVAPDFAVEMSDALREAADNLVADRREMMN